MVMIFSCMAMMAPAIEKANGQNSQKYGAVSLESVDQCFNPELECSGFFNDIKRSSD